MADSIHYFEYWAGLGITIVTVDGTGVDWLILDGVYLPDGNAPFYSVGAVINMNWGWNPGGPATWATEIRALYPGSSPFYRMELYGVIENVRGGGGNEEIMGTGLANHLVGDPTDVAGGHDVIRGGGGSDTIEGGGGNDVIFGGDENDRLFGEFDPGFLQGANLAAGDDYIYGAGGADYIFAGSGNNSIEGGSGRDTVDYGNFLDDQGGWTFSLYLNLDDELPYVYDSGRATVTTIDPYSGETFTTASDILRDVERVIGTAWDDVMIANRYYGKILEGGAGDDVLVSGYYVDSLYGGAGNDTLRSIGEALSDPMWADLYDGGAGDDTYVIEATGTLFNPAMFRIVERAGQGRDHVISASSFILPNNVEALTLTGTAVTGQGNVLSNELTGNGADNTLLGMAGSDRLVGLNGNDVLNGGTGADTLNGGNGNDRLVGSAGNDSLFGAAGDDILIGSEGRDVLRGGTGRDVLDGGLDADRFVFGSVADMGLRSTRDMIRDFVSGADLVVLTNVAAGLDFIGAAEFGQTGPEVRFDPLRSLLQVDIDGDGRADGEVLFRGGTGPVEADFLL